MAGTTFSVAYLIHGKLGLGVYEVKPDGRIEGPLVDDLHGGGLGKGGHFGHETLTPVE